MSTIDIFRIYQSEICTLGVIVVDYKLQLVSLELPWKDNAQNVSCVPVGEYEYFKRVSPSREYEVIELKNVPGREYIQIHIGNYPRDTRGCILVGVQFKSGLDGINASGVAMRSLMAMVEPSGTVRIHDGVKRLIAA